MRRVENKSLWKNLLEAAISILSFALLTAAVFVLEVVSGPHRGYGVGLVVFGLGGRSDRG